MVDEAKPDADRGQEAFEQLLARYPECGVGAVGANGFFVAMPTSVSLGCHTVLQARSGVDLVLPEDRVGMARAWGDARSSGIGRAAVHLLDGHPATCHLLDVRARHGVWMLVLVLEAADGPGPDSTFAVGPPIVPRVCTMLLEETSVIAAMSDATTGMLGWEPAELIGQPTLEFVHPDDHIRAIDSWMATLTTPGVAHRMRCRYQHKFGSWLWVEVTMIVLDGAGEEGMVRSELVDISEEMAAHDAVRSRERLLHQLTEALPTGVVQVDRSGRIVYKNDRVEQIVGHPEATTFAEQFTAAEVEDQLAMAQAIDRALADSVDQEVEVRLGSVGLHRGRVCQVMLRPLTDELGHTTGAIVSISDVTESTVLRTELQARATYDSLTGVHNRASIMALLNAALSHATPAGAGAAVLFIDLDRFKLVNDHLGHSSGDRLLKVVAERLRGAIRDDDLVGRLGGDEFLVVCPTMATAARTRELAERVTSRLNGRVALDGVAVEVCASVGAAWSAESLVNADALVAWADTAMYESKREGLGRPVVVTYTAAAAGRSVPAGPSRERRRPVLH
ncbi:MAG: sensor domain-containing diguanylate cyclase [Actinomycetota bacterium]|nr:sensor domain-containing diguanylate cyclase [Actinomycetota bacterium]